MEMLSDSIIMNIAQHVNSKVRLSIEPFVAPFIGVMMYGYNTKHNAFFLHDGNDTNAHKMAHFKADGCLYEDFRKHGRFYICSYLDFLEEEDADTIRAKIKIFSSNLNNNACYSISYSGECRDVNGEFVSSYMEDGLTCATFILFILESYGFSVVNYNGWPITPEDREWQEDHKNNFSCLGIVGEKPRFRPEQVIGACCCFDGENSLSYNKVQAAATHVMRVFNEEQAKFRQNKISTPELPDVATSEWYDVE